MQGLYRKALRYKGQCGIIKTAVLAPPFDSVEKVDTILVEDAVRSKIFDFQTALPTLAVPEKNLRLERVFFSTAAP